MNNLYLISDIHFGHPAAFKFASSRIDAVREYFGIDRELDVAKLRKLFDEMIIEKWNKTVNQKDVVYCLGDVFCKSVDEEILRKLNGQKTLILGNHDKSLDLYEKTGWRVVKIANNDNPKRSYLIEEHCGERIMFSHYPIFYDDAYDREIVLGEKEFLRQVFVEEKCSLNVHGHIHETDSNNLLSVNVCVEKTAFEPIGLDVLIRDF